MRRRTAYELSESQVTTPTSIVRLFWRIIQSRRAQIGRVLDVGSGDCRFAEGGVFDHYTGIEIDRDRIAVAKPPQNGRIIQGCAFRHRTRDYDACIGNPPYVRHHDIERPWKERTADRLARELGVVLNKHCNLYLYFFCLGLLKTHDQGLVALVIPYEWVSRPSADRLRRHIQNERWHVAVYRFQVPIFEGVLTTASISIVDKSRRDGAWEFYDITRNGAIIPRQGIVDCRQGALQYARRGRIWALRGLSPGSQKIFTLTEGERVHNGLSRRDVVPCVTTLRNVPPDLLALTRLSFRKHFIDAGERCWLIRSDREKRSDALTAYLKSVRREDRQTFTCRNQSPWFNYSPHPVPRLLLSSGFVTFGPKVLINSVKAVAVGAVFGIHASAEWPIRRLQSCLLRFNFEKRVVAHAKTLKKAEVRQVNAVLNGFSEQE
jgi:Eco57I restriction-modification methylase